MVQVLNTRNSGIPGVQGLCAVSVELRGFAFRVWSFGGFALQEFRV